jgi:Ankyrin repeats (3 copies)
VKKILLILMLCCLQLQGSESQNVQENNHISSENIDKDLLEVQINQSRIIDNMILYLNLIHRDVAVVNKGGVCNGLAFLAQYYASLGREDEFFIALESMSAWDGKSRSLKAPTRIPHVYSNLGNLFDQWINDISWFQQSYLRIASVPNYEISHQRRRVQQYEMIKRTDEYREIGLICSPILYNGITEKQLAELLEIWTWYPNTIVEFGGSRHATSARVLEDGRVCYYDPNIPNRLHPYDFMTDVVHIIQDYKYKLLGFPSDKMVLEVMAYQYVGEGQSPVIPEILYAIKNGKTGANSPNGFTPLHLAIYANDFEYFLTLLEQVDCDPNKADKMGITPLYLATQMWKEDYILALLNHPKININKKANSSPILAAFANYNIDAAEMLLKKGADIFLTPFEKQGIQQIMKQNKKEKLFSVPAVILCCMEKEDLEFVKELCKRVPQILYRQDEQGLTLLDYASLFGNQDLYEILIKAGR